MRRALLPQFALLASFKAQICHLLITAWHATIFFRPNQGYRQILVTKKIFFFLLLHSWGLDPIGTDPNLFPLESKHVHN